MAVNSNIGVGSGLPLEATLAKLREVENVSLSLVQTRYDQVNQRLSAYGKLKGALEAFQNAAKEVGRADALGAMKAASNADGVKISVNTKAIAGEYQIEVEQLARAQTLVAKGLTERNAAIGEGGKITFTRADGTNKTLDLSGKGTSLDEVVRAINADASLGLSATIVNDGSSTPHRLLLTTKDTGEQAALAQVQVEGNSELNDVLGFGLTDPGNADNTINHMGVQQSAQDAKLTINGIAVKSVNNTIENAIEGVSLTLSKTGAATVTVTADGAAANQAIQSFVKAYNMLQGTINSLTAYDPANQRGSALTGDSLARRVQIQMRATLNAVTAGETGTLARMGISTDPNNGQLKTDSAKLDAALKDSLPDVLALFTGENGIAARVASASDDFLRSDGAFATSDAGIQKTLKSLENEYASTERRIDDKIAAYRAQFVALDRSVAQMSSVSSYLSTQLSMLNNLAAGQGK